MLAPYRGGILHYVGPPGENDSLFEGLDITLGSADQAAAILLTHIDAIELSEGLANRRGPEVVRAISVRSISATVITEIERAICIAGWE